MANNTNQNQKENINNPSPSIQPNSPNESTSNKFAAANQMLYGPFHGYPFTPYQPSAPHTTPANMTQYVPPPTISPLSPQPQLNLERFMFAVNQKLNKLDLLDDILTRVVAVEGHCERIDNEMSCI